MKVQIPVPENRLMKGTSHSWPPSSRHFPSAFHSTLQLSYICRALNIMTGEKQQGKGMGSDKKIRVSKGAGKTIKKRTLLRASWTQNDHQITNHFGCTDFRHIFSCKALSNYVRQLCMVPLHTWKNQGSASKWDSEQVWLVQSCFPLQPWSSKDHTQNKTVPLRELCVCTCMWTQNLPK